jgi:hypothetical protein
MDDAPNNHKSPVPYVLSGTAAGVLVGTLRSKKGYDALLAQIRTGIQSAAGERALGEFDDTLAKIRSATSSAAESFEAITAFTRKHGLDGTVLKNLKMPRGQQIAAIGLPAAIGALAGYAVFAMFKPRTASHADAELTRRAQDASPDRSP